MFGAWVLVILILVSSIPVIAVFIWFRRAKFQFSIARLLFALLAGAVAFFPALVLQELLDFQITAGGRAGLFYNYFFRIAFTEEISRLLTLAIFFLISGLATKNKSPYSNEQMGVAIGLIAGLGFAILENARYAAADMDIYVALLRFFTAALHGACGARIGSAAVTFRKNPVQALLRVLTATAIHGVYNLMVTLPGLSSIIAVLIALSAATTAIVAIRGDLSENAIDKTKETS